MADPVVKLKLTFKDDSEKDTEMSYNYANKSVTGAQAKALMDAIVANNAAFKNNPTTAVKAAIVETTETDINLNG